MAVTAPLPHVGGGVERSARQAGRGIEKGEEADLARQVLLLVVDIIADDSDPRRN